MIKIALITVLLASIGSTPAVGSDLDWQEEVDYLLIFIEQSDCSFTRNNKEYDSAQARDHIAKKYDYVKKRINSTEQFITYAASKSSITGRPYQVTCGTTTMPSSTWLEEALQSYRSAR